MNNMAKKSFHQLILNRIGEKIPEVWASQAAEKEAKMLCDILAGAIINDKHLGYTIYAELGKFAETLISHDEQEMRAYLFETMKKVITD
jgi:hypothetical protein